MSWLKGILEENRRTVQGWPAWKRGEPREERTLTREAFEAINRRSQALEMAENTNGTDIVICHDDWSSVMRNDTSQRALIEQQAGVIKRQCDYIAQLKQTISVHEQAGLEGLVRDYNDHRRIEQQAKEIARFRKALEYYAKTAISARAIEALEEHP